MTDHELPDGRLPQARLFLSEADRRLASYDRRFVGLNSGLTTLVGTAAVAGSLATASRQGGWIIAALSFTVIAATLGVIGLTPRRSNELPLSTMRAELFAQGEAASTLQLADRRAALASANEPRVKHKARLLQAGLIALLAALSCLLASVIRV